MRGSLLEEIIIYTHNKGYRINQNGEILNPKKEIIKGYIDSDYHCFSIRYKNLVRYVHVHRLVGYQKFGKEIFNEDKVIRHLNNNSLDNSYNNIGIGTHQDNMLDKPGEQRLQAALIATSFVRKYDKKDVQSFYNDCKSYKKTMKHFDISSKGTLWFILNK